MSHNNIQNRKSFRITKKIAKHGSQSVIIVPRILESYLKPGTIVELKIEIIKWLINNIILTLYSQCIYL